MPSSTRLDNRVKVLRQARGWTQDELARAAGLSRTGVSAIEAARLIPSVATAIGLAKALSCSVENLFGPQKNNAGSAFAWAPTSFPCRYWAAEVAGRTLLYPVESSPRGGLMHDGVARHAEDFPAHIETAATTLVLATCDPAVGFLAAAYRRHSGMRMLCFTRSSAEALDFLQRGFVHVAGVHLAASTDGGGNAQAIAARALADDLSLLHVAQWEEGLACNPSARLRSAASAARGSLRWIGRSPGAGARRCQDELLGARRSPRHLARDHRGVVEAIRSGWADVGVCLRLASEEGQLAFLPVAEEVYDLCFREDQASDLRIVSLMRTVRSAEYRGLLNDLPGYRAQTNLGDVESLSAISGKGTETRRRERHEGRNS